MSVPQSPLTYESVLELFRQTDRKIVETAQIIRELGIKQEATDRQIKRTSREVGKLSSRLGKVIENMVKGDIAGKFQTFGYIVTKSGPNVKFGNKSLPSGEIDLFLEDGDVAILIEVKTTLETKDVRKHIERIEKYRQYANATSGDKRRFIGAVAGAVVEGDAEAFAHENGMYVIVQSGKAVEIVTPPEGFKAREW